MTYCAFTLFVSIDACVQWGGLADLRQIARDELHAASQPLKGDRTHEQVINAKLWICVGIVTFIA